MTCRSLVNPVCSGLCESQCWLRPLWILRSSGFFLSAVDSVKVSVKPVRRGVWRSVFVLSAVDYLKVSVCPVLCGFCVGQSVVSVGDSVQFLSCQLQILRRSDLLFSILGFCSVLVDYVKISSLFVVVVVFKKNTLFNDSVKARVCRFPLWLVWRSVSSSLWILWRPVVFLIVRADSVNVCICHVRREFCEGQFLSILSPTLLKVMLVLYILNSVRDRFLKTQCLTSLYPPLQKHQGEKISEKHTALSTIRVRVAY